MKHQGYVYLLHFSPALHHSSHYIGFAKESVLDRVQKHQDGTGAKIVKAAVAAGCEVELVRTWENVDRNFERKLKNRKNAKGLCPVCCSDFKKKTKANRNRVRRAKQAAQTAA